LAEFDDANGMVCALEALHARGHRTLDAYSPYPVAAADRVLGLGRSTVARFTLAGGVLGALTAYGGQYWIMAVDYPINVGGRPLHSAPAMIPVTFELTVLFAALATVLGLIVRARLGFLYQPEDEARGFESASIDKFWVAVGPEGRDTSDVERELLELGALRVVPFGGES
jgi:hypothetical protein